MLSEHWATWTFQSFQPYCKAPSGFQWSGVRVHPPLKVAGFSCPSYSEGTFSTNSGCWTLGNTNGALDSSLMNQA